MTRAVLLKTLIDRPYPYVLIGSTEDGRRVVTWHVNDPIDVTEFRRQRWARLTWTVER